MKKEILFKDILKCVPELGLLELYTLESRIKQEWIKRGKIEKENTNTY